MLQLVEIDKGHLLIFGDDSLSSSIVLNKKDRERLLDLLHVEEAKDLAGDE